MRYSAAGTGIVVFVWGLPEPISHIRRGYIDTQFLSVFMAGLVPLVVFLLQAYLGWRQTQHFRKMGICVIGKKRWTCKTKTWRYSALLEY